MKESIFRKKSIDRVSSPEQLNKYMRVISPPIWIIIAAIVILLLGFTFWGIFGRIESKASSVAISDGKQIICYVGESRIDEIKSDMTVVIDSKEYPIESIGETAEAASDILSSYAMHLGSFSSDEFVYPITVKGSLDEGSFKSYIVVESVPAFSFLWGNN